MLLQTAQETILCTKPKISKYSVSQFPEAADGFSHVAKHMVKMAYNHVLHHFRWRHEQPDEDGTDSEHSFPSIEVEISAQNELEAAVSDRYRNNRYVRLFEIAVRIKGIEFDQDSVLWNSIDVPSLQYSKSSKTAGNILKIRCYDYENGHSHFIKEVKLSFDETKNAVAKHERLSNPEHREWTKTTMKMVVAGNMEKSWKEISSYCHGIHKLLRRFCYFSVEINDAKKGCDLKHIVTKSFESDRSELPPSRETVQDILATIDRYGADIGGMLINQNPFEIVGDETVWCHCSMKPFVSNSKTEEEEKSEEKASQAMNGNHGMEMEEVKRSWIRVQLIKNGQLIHPITERDDVLYVLNKRIKWKAFGVRRFLDPKWTVTDDASPSLSRRMATANALYSGHQYRMTITFVINGCANEQSQERYYPEITEALKTTLDRSLNRIKKTVGEDGENLIYSELLYSAKEKKLENTLSQNIPLIAERLAHILVDSANDPDFDRYNITRNSSGTPIDEQVFGDIIKQFPDEHQRIYHDENAYPTMKDKLESILWEKMLLQVDTDKIDQTLSSIYDDRDDGVQTDSDDGFYGEEDDEELCAICGVDDPEENHLALICDGCDKVFHTFCVGLDRVPPDDWFCSDCFGSSNNEFDGNNVRSINADVNLSDVTGDDNEYDTTQMSIDGEDNVERNDVQMAVQPRGPTPDFDDIMQEIDNFMNR